MRVRRSARQKFKAPRPGRLRRATAASLAALNLGLSLPSFWCLDNGLPFCGPRPAQNWTDEMLSELDHLNQRSGALYPEALDRLAARSVNPIALAEAARGLSEILGVSSLERDWEQVPYSKLPTPPPRAVEKVLRQAGLVVSLHLVNRHPALFGRLEGVPWLFRDRANRARLLRDYRKYDDQLWCVSLQQQIDAWSPIPFSVGAVHRQRRLQEAVIDETWRDHVLQSKLQVVLYDKEEGLALGAGDPSRAGRLFAVTTGAETSPSVVSAYDRDFQRMQQSAQEMYQRLEPGSPDEVAGLLYLTPRSPHIKSLAVLKDDRAKAIAGPLSRLVGGMQAVAPKRAASQGWPPTTLFGESYGGLDIAQASERIPVDRLVTVGSIGLGWGVNSLEELRRRSVNPAIEVSAIRWKDDPTQYLPDWFQGRDPTAPRFGAEVLKAEKPAKLTAANDPWGVYGHTAYFEKNLSLGRQFDLLIAGGTMTPLMVRAQAPVREMHSMPRVRRRTG